MTKPKKWYLESTRSGIVLKSDGGDVLRNAMLKKL